MPDDGSSEIARRDEILELLYWLEGESLGSSSTLATMSRFMAHDPAQVQVTLDALIARGDVRFFENSGEYKLTEVGRRDAARRFAEEFSSMLSQGHGECSDPDCDCHSSDGGAGECHARSHPHNH